ncbi:hypothetical protein NLU13_9948 [Sarocladium strictum]|uniref:Uncharacterized protein n=1 Tax=Sarocladium strictum TaxID=5046 RepID=A0AA39G8I6_SARSR|nr:hypothetical protein NLU13_9948 [Sarocladium strictum]
MPLFTAELSEFWLGEGQEYIRDVLAEDLAERSSECGFPQAVQRKLRAFDSDVDIHDALSRHLSRVRDKDRSAYDPVLNNLLVKATDLFLKPSRLEALEYTTALLGLGYLDATEVYRLQMHRAALTSNSLSHDDGCKLRLLNELHEAARSSYRSFYLGFRVSILLNHMVTQSPGNEGRESLLACLNTMFPSLLPLESDDDINPDPCTPGLRESIRLTLFNHLLDAKWASLQQQKVLQTRLVEWCGTPRYDEARMALSRYNEITRKWEEVLADIFTHCEDTADLSLGSPKGGHFNSSAGARTSTPDHTLLCRLSSGHSSSSSSGPQTGRSFESSFCVEAHPLFRGMPGREISASRTDGAAFMGDLEMLATSPVLPYPDDVCRDQWTQHPIAKSLTLSAKEKAYLGLILPAEVPSRDF